MTEMGQDRLSATDRSPLELHGTRLVLRPLEPTDAHRVRDILNDPAVGPMIRQISLPYGLAAATVWLEGHAAERRAGQAYRFAVVLRDRMIGCADVDEIAGRCGELGYWFDPGSWGRG